MDLQLSTLRNLAGGLVFASALAFLSASLFASCDASAEACTLGCGCPGTGSCTSGYDSVECRCNAYEGNPAFGTYCACTGLPQCIPI